MERERTLEIRRFILTAIEAHPGEVARRAAQEYGISRQAVNRHLQALLTDGLIEATGKTRAREYRLRPVQEITRKLNVTPVLTEDRLWKEYVRPLLADAPRKIREVCQFGFTEAANNALEHSGAERIALSARRTASTIDIAITDNGAGIFRTLASAFGYASSHETLFELSKGKISTVPAKHQGGSLFLASRMFDRFEIQSDDYTFAFDGDSEAWSSRHEPFAIHGTSIRMHTSLFSPHSRDDTIATWTTPRGELGRAHVCLSLLEDEDDALVTRAQGRRVTARLEEQSEVLLDFRGVESVGRAFVDEVFRVFRTAFPDTALVTLNATAQVRARIRDIVGPHPSSERRTPLAASTKDERPARG